MFSLLSLSLSQHSLDLDREQLGHSKESLGVDRETLDYAQRHSLSSTAHATIGSFGQSLTSCKRLIMTSTLTAGPLGWTERSHT